ncbi:MAG: heparinase II/III family protein [Deltaproteobacteria bacterium]|nr:heparinase II/III family protein [Deltaproteobacteria bacterium]
MRLWIWTLGGLLWPCTILGGTWSEPGMDVGERPRVLFGPQDVDTIRGRLPREPYAGIYLRVFERAGDSGYDLEDHETSSEQRKANVAQAAAFVYALDRKAHREGDAVAVEPFADSTERQPFGDRAAELLAHMIPTCRMEDLLTATLDIHCAQELGLYATAYDLLAGAGYPFDDAAAIEDRLAAFTADFFYKWTVRHWDVSRSANENHGSKTGAAIGLAGIVLNGYDRQVGGGLDGYADPVDWIDFGLATAHSLGLEALTAVDGGYAEGPVYYRYGDINCAPFFWAWHRYTRGASREIDGLRFDDPWTEPRRGRTLDWLLSILLPDMSFPPFDDNTPGTTFFWGPFVALPGGAHYRWAWERGLRPLDTAGSVDQSPLTLVAFDDSVAAEAPGFGPSIFAPQNGQAIFRSSWDPDAVYLIMMAEHGVVAGRGFRHDGEWLDGAGGHEHSDPGSTHMVAYGEVLVLDSGYLGWEQHHKVRMARNHNIAFVDGKGPQDAYLSIPPFDYVDGQIVWLDPSQEGGWVPGRDAEASLRAAFSLGGVVEHARVDARYFEQAPPTDWSRHMLFVGGRYFVQADRLVSDDGAAHRYEVLAHVHGGGSSGGEYVEIAGQGARVQRDLARLELRVASSGAACELSTGEDVHDAGSWREETHSVLHAAIDGPGQADFLWVLYPLRGAEPDPEIERLASGDGLAAWRVGDAAGEAFFGLAAPESGAHEAGELAFTGALAAAGISGAGQAEWLLVADGMAVSLGERAIGLVEPGTLAVRWEPDRLQGAYFGGANRLTVEGVASAAGGSGYCGLELQASSVELVLAGPGRFEIELGAGGDARPTAVISAAREGLVGQPIALDGSASCDAEGAALRHDWRLVDRPLRSQAELQAADRPVATLVPDRPGAYRVGLRVSDAAASSDEALALVWVERASPQADGGIADGGDADGSDAGPADEGHGAGGCGCAGSLGSCPALWLIACMLTVLRRWAAATRR